MSAVDAASARPTAPEGDLISTHDTTPAAARNRPTTTPFSTPASDSAGTPVRRDPAAGDGEAVAAVTNGAAVAAPAGPPAAYTVDWSNPEAMKDDPAPRPTNGSATPRTTGFASDAAPIPAVSWSDPR